MRVIAERAAAGSLPVDVRVVISDQPAAAGLADGGGDEHRDARACAARLRRPRVVRPGAGAAARSSTSRSSSCWRASCGSSRRISSAHSPAASSTCIPRCCRTIAACTRIGACSKPARTLHGVSVHFVTEELDGGPVILQAEVPVLPGDSETTLSARVQQGRTQDLPAGDRLVRARAIAVEGRPRVARRQAAGRSRCGNRRRPPAVSQRTRVPETECEGLAPC